MTPNSVGSRWVHFEAGGAFLRNRLIPVCAGGEVKGSLDEPMSLRQARSLDDETDTMELITDIASRCGLPTPDPVEVRRRAAAIVSDSNVDGDLFLALDAGAHRANVEPTGWRMGEASTGGGGLIIRNTGGGPATEIVVDLIHDDGERDAFGYPHLSSGESVHLNSQNARPVDVGTRPLGGPTDAVDGHVVIRVSWKDVDGYENASSWRDIQP